MSSKSKGVRIEQLRIFEKKLALRLEQLAQKGIIEKKAQSDPLVKSLKSNIRETNVRIAAFEKFVKKAEELAHAKAQKLAEAGTKKEEKAESEPKEAEPKAKKAAKEPKKQPAATDEAAPKKAKKPAAAADAAEPKKKTSKKKEE